jgi:hypothetical protein
MNARCELWESACDPTAAATAIGRFTLSLSLTQPPERGVYLKDLVIELACKLVIEVVESAPFKEMVHHWVDSLLFYLLH